MAADTIKTSTIKPDVTKPAVNTKHEQVCFATLQFEGHAVVLR